jgi:uncharacterized membrane protein
MTKKSINELTPNEVGLVKTVCNTVLALLAAVFALMLISLLTIPIHALLLMICWNYALTSIFNAPHIGFFQSLCLVIIARILIRSINNDIKT